MAANLAHLHLIFITIDYQAMLSGGGGFYVISLNQKIQDDNMVVPYQLKTNDFAIDYKTKRKKDFAVK